MHTSTPTLPTEYTHLQFESSLSLQTTVHNTSEPRGSPEYPSNTTLHYTTLHITLRT